MKENLLLHQVATRYMLLCQVSSSIKFQLYFDGGVAALFSDQNFPAMVRSFPAAFAVLGAQVVGQVDPGSYDLATAGTLHRDFQ